MKKITGLFALLFLLSGGHVFAAGDATEVSALSASMDTVWIMIAAFLVFFMHAGFAMVETGFTRSKNALNIL